MTLWTYLIYTEQNYLGRDLDPDLDEDIFPV